MARPATRRTPRGVGRQSTVPPPKKALFLIFDGWRLDVIGVSQPPLPRARTSSNRVTGNWWVRMDGLVAQPWTHRWHYRTVMNTAASSIGVCATPPSTTVQLILFQLSKHFTRAITAQERLRMMDCLVSSCSCSCRRLGPVRWEIGRDHTKNRSAHHHHITIRSHSQEKNNTVQTVAEPRGTVLRASCGSLGARGGEEERIKERIFFASPEQKGRAARGSI